MEVPMNISTITAIFLFLKTRTAWLKIVRRPYFFMVTSPPPTTAKATPPPIKALTAAITNLMITSIEKVYRFLDYIRPGKYPLKARLRIITDFQGHSILGPC
jgi:hypothetical protein